MNKFFFVSFVMLSTSAFANSGIPKDQQIKSFTVEEVSTLNFQPFSHMNQIQGNDGGSHGGSENGAGDQQNQEPSKPTFNDKLDTTGKVIQTARDLVALGEAVYELVKKGRPSNVTEFAAISVVPRDPESKQYVDPFDLEGFSMPVEKSYVAKVKNGSNKEVVKFTYRVIYAYGGSFNGKGKYLTNVMIVPGAIKTSYGWDFNATMKLSGIMNHGTKAEPVAGAMVAIKYQMNSWSAAFERNDTIHITGAGAMKNHMVQ